MVSSPSFRLTFNLPAQLYLFGGDDVVGMHIKVENNKAYFKPAGSIQTEDSVKFTSRPRGGYEAHIEGDMSGELLAALTVEGSISFPFFIVKADKADRGWISVQHYKGQGAPAKFTPHMRLWMPKEKMEPGIKAPLDDEIESLLGSFASVVRVAKQIIDDYDFDRRVGRPPREVMESRDVLAAFETLSREILPPQTSSETFTPVRHAMVLLEEFLREKDIEASKPIRIPTVPREMVAEIGDEETEVEDENPPQIQKSVSNPVSPVVVQQIPEGKRGRGRPRKHPLPVIEPTPVVEDEEPKETNEPEMVLESEEIEDDEFHTSDEEAGEPIIIPGMVDVDEPEISAKSEIVLQEPEPQEDIVEETELVRVPEPDSDFVDPDVPVALDETEIEPEAEPETDPDASETDETGRPKRRLAFLKGKGKRGFGMMRRSR